MRARSFNLAVLALSAGEYAANRLFLRAVPDGPIRRFLVCYCNDLFAGATLLAWANLLLEHARFRPLTRLHHTVPLLLICGLVWEILAPLWKAGAVFDPWDFLAYQAGGLVYLSARRLLVRDSAGNSISPGK